MFEFVGREGVWSRREAETLILLSGWCDNIDCGVLRLATQAKLEAQSGSNFGNTDYVKRGKSKQQKTTFKEQIIVRFAVYFHLKTLKFRTDFNFIPLD